MQVSLLNSVTLAHSVEGMLHRGRNESVLNTEELTQDLEFRVWPQGQQGLK